MLSRLSNVLGLPTLSSAVADVSARDALSLGVLLTLMIVLTLEARAVRDDRRQRKLLQGSVRANLSLLLFNDVALSLLSATSLMLLAERHGGGGLLSSVQDPLLFGVLAFLLLDLTHYAWHWANHRFDALWMFHKVHHSDRSMNASTAFRLHFMESLLTVLVKALFIVVTGVQASMVLLSEAIMALFVIFHHASLSVPGEKWLGRVIVVPMLHRVHHSTLRREHDNNYGAVFSIWDRLFGTLAEREPARLGLKNVGTLSFIELLKFGLTAGGGKPAHALTAMIAEAAYFKAEKRGFAPGMEMLDWLEAEREITEQMGS